MLGPAGPAGHLGEQLEGALGGPEIGDLQAQVGVEDAHQGEHGEVVALGQHLGAHQDVHLAQFRGQQPRLQGAPAQGGVPVQAQDPGGREQAAQLVLDLLGALPHPAQVLGAAVDADLRRHRLEAAQVAAQAVGALVVGEAHGAVRAVEGLAAGPAHPEVLEAPAVQQQHALLAPLQGLGHGLEQQRARRSPSCARPCSTRAGPPPSPRAGATPAGRSMSRSRR